MRWLAIIALAAHASAAVAGPRETAEAARRVAQGNKLYQDGRYDDALRLYLAAYDLMPKADTLFNIGLAHEKTLNFEQCALAFRRYLEEGKDDAARERAIEREKLCAERAQIPVKLSSIPPGAAVSIATGGAALTFRGRTPTQLELAPATYKVRVEMPGYVAMEQSVVVDAGARPEVDFPLEKLSSLSIEADVAGATVEIDGGKPEPAPARRELRAGVYKVRLKKPGHKDVSREVAIGAGEQATLVVSLPPLPAERVLNLTAPRGADVRIDGEVVSRVVRLTAGEHAVEARAPRHRSFSGRVTIPADRGDALAIDLAPHRSIGQRIALGASIGASATAAIGSAVYGSMALDAQRDYERTPSLALADRGETYARRSDALTAVAIVGVATAVVVWWATRPGRSRVEVR
jgi:hypothetical protein